MARDIAREVARAEVRALTEALTEAFGATLFSPELSPEELGAGLRDVVTLWSSEMEKRIPSWIGVDPQPIEETSMQLSDQDKKAVELSKMTRNDPGLRRRVQKADETRASKDPLERAHPISKMAEESPVLAEYEAEVLDVMSKDRCSHEVAIGKISRDPAYHDLKRRYREEQRAFRGA
jgi:hypothetical protein